MEENTTKKDILNLLMNENIDIELFGDYEPSLNDIFVMKVGKKMRNFLIVLKFELENYFKNKTYLITTFGIAIVLAIGICIPTIFNFDDQE